MGILNIILIVLQVIASVALILIVLFQSGKESGLGVVSGNSDSYMNKNGGGNLNKKLAAATKWVALAWIVLTLALSLI
jgi:preprotein translocase subunit SecG